MITVKQLKVLVALMVVKPSHGGLGFISSARFVDQSRTAMARHEERVNAGEPDGGTQNAFEENGSGTLWGVARVKAPLRLNAVDGAHAAFVCRFVLDIEQLARQHKFFQGGEAVSLFER